MIGKQFAISQQLLDIQTFVYQPLSIDIVIIILLITNGLIDMLQQ